MVEPHEWRERRHRELGRIEATLADNLCDVGMPTTTALTRYHTKRRTVLHPGWMPPRPPRRMQAPHLVAKYWVGRDPFAVDLDSPACFRCQVQFGEWRTLQRAHLVDRFLGGLDHSGNLTMLCVTCHAIMPMFDVHEGALALAWVGRTTTAHARRLLWPYQSDEDKR